MTSLRREFSREKFQSETAAVAQDLHLLPSIERLNTGVKQMKFALRHSLLILCALHFGMAHALCLEAHASAVQSCSLPAGESSVGEGPGEQNPTSFDDSGARGAALQTSAISAALANTAQARVASCEQSIVTCERLCASGNLDGQAQAKNQAAYNFCHRELRRNALVHLNSVADAAVMSQAAAQRSLASMNDDGAPTTRADDGRYQEADATRHYIFEKMDDSRTQFTVPMGIQGLGKSDILKASPGFKCIRNCN